MQVSFGKTAQAVVDEGIRVTQTPGVLRKGHIDGLDGGTERFHDGKQQCVGQNECQQHVLDNVQISRWIFVRNSLTLRKVARQ